MELKIAKYFLSSVKMKTGCWPWTLGRGRNHGHRDWLEARRPMAEGSILVPSYICIHGCRDGLAACRGSGLGGFGLALGRRLATGI